MRKKTETPDIIRKNIFTLIQRNTLNHQLLSMLVRSIVDYLLIILKNLTTLVANSSWEIRRQQTPM